ncbi:cobalamin biosynthesis protein CobD [Sulfuriferula plumbiphila]|uniref:Cobalamin biosynthesis protein CobD n=1 Tax=Sulfuriferula plumbiphila TaxID=171865 RepID=A0A512LAM6_9PROT|nr:CobD/CbiB family protein [Sulfuriferula plumbiphila]BBP03391.1 cobalamin biosynthesis protein CobD [Sulfuriferula plumbiphila]GEP31527.1 cobalamin biosynthesis protein CobD [Sulfuriferula plumbiphila]
MTFFSLLAALLLEHFRPLGHPLPHYQAFWRYAQYIERQLNTGQYQHGVLAWLVAVLPVLITVGVVYFLLGAASPLLAWAWSALVVYVTLGFKYFSKISARIARALEAGDLDTARNALAEWRGLDASMLNADDIARLATERTLESAHRQMFGVIVCFVLLSPLGPVGAVLYRLASILGRKWGSAGSAGQFGEFAARVYYWINWIPARLTALSFAVAGDFEDAMYCWRTQAQDWPDASEGIVLASGAGALGVRLGLAISAAGGRLQRPELGLGDSADAQYLGSAVSLSWRVLGLWLLTLLLITLAKLAG